MTVKDTAQRASEAVGETYRTARAKAEETYESAAARTAETVERNPLAVLAGGLAVGMLIGALLPRTRRETELLGPYGSQITDRARRAATAAREVGHEKFDEFGFVKDAVGNTAKQFLDTARQAASEAGSAAAQSARGED